MAVYWVYILECSNGSFYTGYTNNLEKRYQDHCNGKGAKYTKSFKPKNIAQQWRFSSKNLALKAEGLIKKLSRKEKERVIECPELLTSPLLLGRKLGLKRSKHESIALSLVNHDDLSPVNPQFELYLTYIDGYLDAALCLFDSFYVNKKDVGHYLHTVIYPVLFCLGHAIELMLKFLLIFHNKKNVSGHNLNKLFQELRTITDLRYKKPDFVELAIFEVTVESVIKFFMEIDGQDMEGFRYPVKSDFVKNSLNRVCSVKWQAMHEAAKEIKEHFQVLSALIILDGDLS